MDAPLPPLPTENRTSCLAVVGCRGEQSENNRELQRGKSVDIKDVIQQTRERTGTQYTRQRGTDGFKESLKHWRDTENPRRMLNRMSSLGMTGEMVNLTEVIMGSRRASTFSPLEAILDESQLVSSIFLPLGAERMRAVGRIISESGKGFGTGFLISPRLLITNNHVLDTAERAARCRVQFDYVRRIDGSISATEVFLLSPSEFFLTADPEPVNLDYTIVAVEAVNNDGQALERRGCIPLIATSGKLVKGDFANIIQHPGGDPQQLALRDNQVVDPLEHFIRYEADTQPGSSGSPVFNNFWQVGALHHSGVPKEVRPNVLKLRDGGEWDLSVPRTREDQLRMAARVEWLANEGIRISSIVEDAQRKLRDDSIKLAMFGEAVRESVAPQAPPIVESAVGGLSSRYGSSNANQFGAGAATWTVPVHFSVQFGPEVVAGGIQMFAPNPPAKPHVRDTRTRVVPTNDRKDVEAAARRLQEALASDRRVLEIRPGFLWEHGRMTDIEAVVVVMDPTAVEPADVGAAGPIPDEIDGIPIDVTTGGATALFHAQERLSPVAESVSIADLLQEAVPEITYKPPTDVRLDAVHLPMELICHVSPDDGWPVLEEFLNGVDETLTLGMFDLTAPHIHRKLMTLAAKPSFKLNLAIQRGMAGRLEGAKKNDTPEDEVISSLSKAMGNRLRQVFIDVTGEDRTFASSYHIKVAVRDHNAVWLSSGNMQTTNQPEVRPAAEKSKTFDALNTFNREWHIVIKNKTLSTMFEKFLIHDIEASEENPADPPRPSNEVLFPIDVIDPQFLEVRREPQYFGRKVFPRDAAKPIRIQPLLTPDNFLDHTIPLVRSAKERLFIQNQSLTILQPLSKNEDAFLELFRAIRERQQAGVDVRLIFRVHGRDEDAARSTKEALVRFGFKKASIMAQERCHSKGIVIDSHTVLIGSHNWTNQGAIANRDASLIIRNSDVAKYYERIFLFDWDTLTREPRIRARRRMDESLPSQHEVIVSAEETAIGD